MYYRGTIVLSLHHPWALWPKWATLWHIRVSQCGRAFRDECLGLLSLKWVFEGQYQTAWVCRYCALAYVLEVATYTSVPVLRPSLRVGGCYIHPLFGTVFLNDSAWAWEGWCLDRTQMEGCSGSPYELKDTRAHSRWHNWASYDADDIPRLEVTLRHMDPVDGNRDDKMRCDVALRDLGPSRGKVEPNGLA